MKISVPGFYLESGERSGLLESNLGLYTAREGSCKCINSPCFPSRNYILSDKQQTAGSKVRFPGRDIDAITVFIPAIILELISLKALTYKLWATN